jgi:hypothetical protein
MLKSLFFVCSLHILGSLAFAGPTAAPKMVELSADAAKKVGTLLRKASNGGDKSVQFVGGPQVTQYSVGNLDCYFQNNDDSVSCSTESDLSAEAAKMVGSLLRKANNSGDRTVQFVGGPQVTQYSVGNVDCYFQNSDDSVTCSAD